jgi:hypothetical protein
MVVAVTVWEQLLLGFLSGVASSTFLQAFGAAPLQWLRALVRHSRWGFWNPGCLQISLAGYLAKDHSDKLSMGEGQVRALDDIAVMTSRWFPWTKQSITITPKLTQNGEPASAPPAFAENNYLVLGGPKYNSVSAMVFERLKQQNISFEFDGKLKVDNTNYTNSGEHGNRTEHALLAFVVSPHNDKKRAIVFAGCTTFGVHAATRFFRQQVWEIMIRLSIHRMHWKNWGKQNCAMVLKFTITDGYPNNISIKYCKRF